MYVDHPNHEQKLRAAEGVTLQPGHNDDDDEHDDGDDDDDDDDDDSNDDDSDI